jgi:DHA2 family multidrug resistance protein-like MFS transporter
VNTVPASSPAPDDAPAKPKPFEGLPVPRRHWAAATVLTGISLAVLDATIANVALPTIASDLNTSSASAVWVINAYSLTLVVLLLPVSALAERIGFRRMFGFGLILFTLASLACASANSLTTLTMARAFQGLGASCIMGLTGGLMRNIYPLSQLGRGMSWNSLTVGLMSVLGPTVGSAILSVASWPWIFAVNLPIGIIAIFGLRSLPDMPRTDTRFDWLSALMCMITLGMFVSGVDYLGQNILQAFGILAISAGAGALLWHRVRRQPAPLVPVDLLRIRQVAYAVIASTFTFAAQMSAYVSLPFYFQEVLMRPHLQLGLLMGAWPLGTVIIAPFAGRLSDKYSPALLSGIGAGGMALGLLWIALLPLSASNSWIMAGMFMAGLGFGFFQTPNNRAMLSSAPRSRSGAAGGLQATTRVFGQSLGTALVAIAFSVSTAHGSLTGVVMASVCAALAILINTVRANRLRPGA